MHAECLAVPSPISHNNKSKFPGSDLILEDTDSHRRDATLLNAVSVGTCMATWSATTTAGMRPLLNGAGGVTCPTIGLAGLPSSTCRSYLAVT